MANGNPKGEAAASFDVGDGPAGVELRTIVANSMPLAVVGLPVQQASLQLVSALEVAGITSIDAFVGAELPRGARVGFVLDGQEVRLVNDTNDPLIRAPRHGLDVEWMERARANRGTMLVFVANVDLSPVHTARDLVLLVDERARAGGALGAIVGFVEERPSLPLLFG